VLDYDLHIGIPFADNSFDVIYHSHALEHMEPPWAERLLHECCRTLKPGGLLRIAVPDLENIARAYLTALDDARVGDVGARARHRWMLIEMLDQLTRRKSGGDMLRYFSQDPLPQKDFILSRLGGEAQNILAWLRARPLAPDAPSLLPPEFDAAFQRSGELHRWMYDEISLAALLLDTGFADITRQSHDASLRPDILRYRLDTLEDGSPRKPDSLFMEAVKHAPPMAGTQPLRVALFCTYDHGGAGTAALRLHKALRGLAAEGVISQFYCASQKSLTEGAHLAPVFGQGARGTPRDSAELSGLGQCRHDLAVALKAYPDRPAGREFFSLPQLCCDPAKIPL
jgi:SAM-dependent methyltransferase